MPKKGPEFRNLEFRILRPEFRKWSPELRKLFPVFPER
jgi:hypothetical protein